MFLEIYEVDIINNVFWQDVFIAFLGAFFAICGALFLFYMQTRLKSKGDYKENVAEIIYSIRCDCTIGLPYFLNKYNDASEAVSKLFMNTKKMQNHLEKIRLSHSDDFVVFKGIIDKIYKENNRINEVAFSDIKNDIFSKSQYFDFFENNSHYTSEILFELEKLYNSL